MFKFNTNKVYELSLATSYVSDWTLQEALRELFQNAYDNKSDPEILFIANKLRIINKHTVLEPATLLLGTTSKEDDPKQIGQYGEGYKLALLVLLREGHQVSIINGDKLWTPAIIKSPTYGVDVLAITETDNTLNNKDSLCFIIDNITPDEYAEAQQRCLHLRDRVDVIHKCCEGDILEDEPGKLFVGGLFVCDTELTYGYNLHPDSIELDRDRMSVSYWDLTYITTKMWMQVHDHAEVARLIKRDIADVNYASSGIPSGIQDTCYQLYSEEYGDAPVVSDQKELELYKSKGIDNAVIIHNSGYRKAIINSPSYTNRNKITILEDTPRDILEAFTIAHSKKLPRTVKIALKNLIKTTHQWSIR